MISTMRVVVAVCLILLGLCAYTVSAQNLDIWCISGGDDGPGTGTIIRGPNGTVVLFDEGYSALWANACKGVLAGEGITNIGHAIASHYHADHIGGLDDLIIVPTPISISKCWDRGGTMTYATRLGGTPIPIPTPYATAVAECGGSNEVVVDGSTDIDLGNGAMLYFLSVGAEDNAEGEGGLVNTTYIRGGGEVAPGNENSKSITAL
ncbi:MAG: MBL fold metallo-hydrolase, partial [bacterium]